MSLKAVELQIALPKTFDAGKMADNHQQNIVGQQLHANEALKKELERKQFSVNESEELDTVNDEEENGGNAQSPTSQRKNKNKKMKETPAQHPFKGNLFDVSG